MPTDDLSGLSGLDDKQRAILEDKLGIASGHALIMAETRDLLAAFKGRRGKPTLEDVVAWQDEARRAGGAMPSIARSGWEQAAMFVVAFEQRQAGAETERRLVAEQYDIEAETTTDQCAEWEGWTGEDICEWMTERVPVPPARAAGGSGEAEAPKELPASEPPAPPMREKLEVESATLSLADGDVALVEPSGAVEQLVPVWNCPTQLLVTLGDSPVKPGTSVVLQLERSGQPKQNISGALDDDGENFEFDLTSLDSGEYRPTLVAKISDGSSLPCLVRLPSVGVVGAATAGATTGPTKSP